MAARFEPRRGLDAEIAVRIVQPKVRRVLDALKDEAQRRAPETRTWVTMRDEVVRPTHVSTDGQTIPANLRFKVEKPGGVGEYELARHPGDTALSPANRYNCRCDDPTIPHLLRQSIHASNVTVSGTVVSGEVYTEFPRAAESEFGNPGEDEAAHFMTGALVEIAARLKAGQFG
jgi:hypothetical protein